MWIKGKTKSEKASPIFKSLKATIRLPPTYCISPKLPG